MPVSWKLAWILLSIGAVSHVVHAQEPSPPVAVRLRQLAESLPPPASVEPSYAGMWSAEGKLPDLYSAGLMRGTALLLPPRDVPANAKIRQIQWTWDSSRRDPWLEVLLCMPSRCLPVTRLGLGVSQAFSGEAAKVPFHWRWQVVGSGGLPTPILVGNVSLRVDWVAPVNSVK